jgi:hypothetical protein
LLILQREANILSGETDGGLGKPIRPEWRLDKAQNFTEQVSAFR